MSERLFDVPCAVCGDSGRVWDPRLDVTRMCDCRAVHLPPPDVNPAAPAGIDGTDDIVRLNKQQARVWAVMSDGSWHTLRAISSRTGDPEASVSARFRDLRKQKYGGHTMERRTLGGGLFEYRLIVNRNARMGRT